VKFSKNPLKTTYVIWFAFWTVLSFTVLYPLIRFALSNPKRYSFGHKIRRFWGKILLVMGFVKVTQIIEEPFDTSKPYIICPNHTSQLDIVTLTVKLNQLDFSFMAKKELEEIPVFGIWFRTIDIAVDRKNIRKAAEAYKKATRFFESGRSLVIFPEGTISNQVPKLIKFKDGPFRMAIEKQIDLLPVTIIGNWEVLPDQGVFEGKPGKTIQYIHKPISTIGLTLDDTDMLKNKVYQIIENKLKEYNHGN
jgi:1-acyl-sn-glycerol-3-phosphate acyltransferase